MGKNIIFGVDINSSVPKQRLDYSTLTVEAKHPINFTKSGKRFVLSLYTIMEVTASYLLMLQKYINSKQKTLKKKDYVFR